MIAWGEGGGKRGESWAEVTTSEEEAMFSTRNKKLRVLLAVTVFLDRESC